MTTGTFLETVSLKVSESLGKQISLRAGAGGGFAGGGGASTSVLVDESTQTKYFIKSSIHTFFSKVFHIKLSG